MSSSGSRRNSGRGVVGASQASSECHVRRRSSSCSYFSSGAQSEDFSVSLSQPIFTITLRFLLAIDLWLSKRLRVCACEKSPWGSIRPLVRLVEFSGHVIPWLIGTVYALLRGGTAAQQEIMLNLALGKNLCLLFWIWVIMYDSSNRGQTEHCFYVCFYAWLRSFMIIITRQFIQHANLVYNIIPNIWVDWEINSPERCSPICNYNTHYKLKYQHVMRPLFTQLFVYHYIAFRLIILFAIEKAQHNRPNHKCVLMSQNAFTDFFPFSCMHAWFFIITCRSYLLRIYELTALTSGLVVLCCG